MSGNRDIQRRFRSRNGYGIVSDPIFDIQQGFSGPILVFAVLHGNGKPVVGNVFGQVEDRAVGQEDVAADEPAGRYGNDKIGQTAGFGNGDGRRIGEMQNDLVGAGIVVALVENVEACGRLGVQQEQELCLSGGNIAVIQQSRPSAVGIQPAGGGIKVRFGLHIDGNGLPRTGNGYCGAVLRDQSAADACRRPEHWKRRVRSDGATWRGVDRRPPCGGRAGGEGAAGGRVGTGDA